MVLYAEEQRRATREQHQVTFLQRLVNLWAVQSIPVIYILTVM